jgi:hypothetical protein
MKVATWARLIEEPSQHEMVESIEKTLSGGMELARWKERVDVGMGEIRAQESEIKGGFQGI